VRVELRRATRRPFSRIWPGWFIVVGAVFTIVAYRQSVVSVGHLILIGASMSAKFGAVPVAVLGLMAGSDDARYRVAKDLHIAGIGQARDTLARVLVAAASAGALWLAGVMASIGVALGLFVAGGATLRSTPWLSPEEARLLLSEALGSGMISLPLLAAVCVAMAVALRSSLLAAAVVLGTTTAWFASVCFVNTLPHLLWVARFTPVGAAYQISTLSTYPEGGGERFHVGLSLAVLAGLIWFVAVPVASLWSVLGQSAEESVGWRQMLGGRSGIASDRAAAFASERDPARAKRAVRLPARVVVAAVLLGALCLGMASEARVFSGVRSFDSTYQEFADQRATDFVLRVAQAVRLGDWEGASALIGTDIRRMAPGFVAYVRRHPEAELWGGESWSEVLGRTSSCVEVATMGTGDGGVAGWGGPAFVFDMTFVQGRWVVRAIFREGGQLED
jgi:hypothetical protein